MFAVKIYPSRSIHLFYHRLLPRLRVEYRVIYQLLYDVFQVTSSCSSVYVDGSEIRGSSNATVIVKYETYTGTAHFIVWVPEINEMDLTIADQKLNQIKGWRVPMSVEADDDMDE